MTKTSIHMHALNNRKYYQTNVNIMVQIHYGDQVFKDTRLGNDIEDGS